MCRGSCTFGPSPAQRHRETRRVAGAPTFAQVVAYFGTSWVEWDLNISVKRLGSLMSAIRRALRAALGLTVPATVVVAGLAVFEHARAGVREIGEPPLALHVARDVGLALVVGLVAVTAVLYRLRNRATAARSIAGAAPAGLAMVAGVFGHDLVFPAAGHGASGLNHDIREATGAAVLGALVALACGARAWLPMLQRRARRAAVVALALSMTMVGASALTGATIAGADREPAPDLKRSGGEQFNNPALDEGDLADKAEP